MYNLENLKNKVMEGVGPDFNKLRDFDQRAGEQGAPFWSLDKLGNIKHFIESGDFAKDVLEDQNGTLILYIENLIKCVEDHFGCETGKEILKLRGLDFPEIKKLREVEADISKKMAQLRNFIGS